MSVPAPREPHEGGRWGTIRYALDNNPRTFRLCLILLVTALGPCLAAIIAALMRHALLWSHVHEHQHWKQDRRPDTMHVSGAQDAKASPQEALDTAGRDARSIGLFQSWATACQPYVQ
jgi:hypothetical protein